VRTPYNFNYWDAANGVLRDMTAAITAIKRGYGWVDMPDRFTFDPMNPVPTRGGYRARRLAGNRICVFPRRLS
jgi:hypothetical protein